MPVPDASDDLLFDALIAKGLLDVDAIEQIIAYQRGPSGDVGGVVFQIDPDLMWLWVGDPLGAGSEPILQPEPPEPWNPAEFPPTAMPLIATFGADGQKVGELTVHGRPSLLLTDDDCFLTADSFRHEPQLPIGTTLVFNGSAPRGSRMLPLDISLSPDFRHLCVIDRGAGTLTLVDTETYQPVQRHQVRPPGSTKAVNLAWIGSRLYATDGQTTSLTVLDVAAGSLSRINMAIGVLGNIVAHPDGRSLLLLTLKPNFALFVIDPNQPVPERAIPIKGDPFSLGQDPTDLMALSPAGDLLLLMTFINEPNPYTPVINVIDVAQQKNVQRFRIPANRKPMGLGFSQANPYYHPKISRLEAARDLGLVDESAIAALQADIAAITASEPVAIAAEDFAAAAVNAAREQLQEPGQDTGPGSAAAGRPKPERTEHLPLIALAEDLIVDACLEHFRQVSEGEDLSTNTVAMDRLRTAAHTCREELEWFTASRIQLSFIDGDRTLDLWIEREQVLEWLRQHERDQLLKEAKIATIPANCPNCNANLFGSYVCRLCGFALDGPEAMQPGRRRSLASPGPLACLADGHLLLPDADRHRILELDGNRQITWQIARDLLQGELPVELQSPYDATRLANGNTLVVDNQANQVIELTPRGRPFWEVPQSDAYPEVWLHRPVRAVRLDGGHTLIVDRGRHRVIEIDRQFELKWQYGQTELPGISPGALCYPSDVQRLSNGHTLITDMGNHRVIEIADGRIVWQYGNPDNLPQGGDGREDGRLSQPKSAWRNESGVTVIVDSGNNRLLLINQAGQPIWEYDTTADPDVRIEQPLRAFTLPSGNLVILGRDRLVEITPGKQVVWSGLLKSLTKAAPTGESPGAAKFRLQRSNPYLRHLEAKRQEAAPATVPTGEPDLSDERRPNATQPDRMLDLAQMAARRLSKPTDQAGELAPLTMLLVYRARHLIYQVNRQKQVLWRWGTGELERPHAGQLLSNGRVIVADTNNHRVIEVDTTRDEIVWHYGEKGRPGNEPGQLAHPRWVQRLPDGHTLIADQSNSRVMEIDPDGLLVWQWGDWETLNGPYCCQRLGGGTTLVTDWSNHVVLEISYDGEIVWQYGQSKQGGSDDGQLQYPEQATRLNNGHTLIVDSRNNRVIEVDPDGQRVWAYSGDGLNKLNGPSFAQRQSDGNTVIVHGGNRQALEVTPQGQVVWKYLLPVEREGGPAARGPGGPAGS